MTFGGFPEIKNFANEISIRKLHNFLVSTKHSLSKDKTYEYFSYLEDIGFAYVLRKLGYGQREIKGSIPKIYLNDVGFATLYGIKDFGRRMENIVSIELFRKKYYYNPIQEIFYWRNYKGDEVDFVIEEGLEVKQLIQVIYASARDEIEGRELRSLVKASELLNCRDLLVIIWDFEEEKKFSGKKIKFLPLWRWLLKV